ncbi:MAG: hypothetical protein HQL56_10460, partial [Magnetococcales bacterium]|nr:hypothetical protein [Magnetococcales bacterium]
TASSLEAVPEQIRLIPIRHAFEKAMMANMTPDEMELYDKAGIAITDARGAVELAREEGEARGRQEGRAEMLLDQLQERFGSVPDWVRFKLTQADLDSLKEWSKRIFGANKIEEIFQ